MLYPINKDTIGIKVSDKNWVERSYGIAKDAWKGIDTTKELEKMRKEWDEKKTQQ
jgi:hypothetical protein